MIKHLLLSLALGLTLSACASAQITTQNGSKSDLTMQKMHEVDLLLQILPLLLTKDQINDKLLPAIEKNRGIFRKELAYEDDELAKIDPILQDALDEAYAKGTYPPRKTTEEVATKTANWSTQRKIIEGIMIDSMIDTLKLTLNAGQMKALVGSFDPRFIDPTAKPETITDDRKLRFFVDRVFLDPTTYEILKKLGKH